MDIRIILKIKVNEKSIIFFLCFSSLFSCSTKLQKQTYFGDSFGKATEEFKYGATSNSWITAYKDEVFYSCIKEGYKNDSIWILMNEEDLFNPYDEMSFSSIDKAKAIGKEIIKIFLKRRILIQKNSWIKESMQSRRILYLQLVCIITSVKN